MFTGIVETIGIVEGLTVHGTGRLLLINAPGWDPDRIVVGESIALNGVCLTVVEQAQRKLHFQVGPETLDRTNLSELRLGDRVNLERALLPTTRLSGHFVQGHVDGVARIAERRPDAEWEWVEFAAASELTDQMVPKGSVALDGVSLTLVAVSSGRFRIMLIPYTLAHTTLGFKTAGARVNVELDILGKYAVQAVKTLLGKP